MTIIKNLINEIDDEICGAKKYAEMYLQHKAKNSKWSAKFKDMAQQELNHAMTMHDYATEEVEELGKVYTPPTEMMEKWEKSHKKYNEKVAFIKMMLTM